MPTATINPKRIFEARDRQKLSQDEVAFRLRKLGHKANSQSIHRWETGQHTPRANIVPDLAAVLGVTIETLYERSESGDDEDEDEMLRRLLVSAVQRGHDDLVGELWEGLQKVKARNEKAVA